MHGLSSSEEAQKMKDREILQLATRRSLSLMKTRRNAYARSADTPDAIDPASLLEVKARWNTYAPISQLPKEILVEIFMIVKDSPHCSFEDLHRLAQICGHWRGVAINTPALWTDLPTGRHDYTLLMLDRSKTAPLAVYLLKDIPAATINAVLNHIERIRTMTLDLPAGSLNDAQSFLSGSRRRKALQLEELAITSHYHPLENSRFTFSLDTFLLTSTLRQLCFSGIRFDWGVLSTLPNLTHLIFDRASVTASISGKHFVAALQQMSNLETLQMSLDRIGLYNYSPTTSPEFIHLPCLTTVLVTTTNKPDLLGHFLSHTKFPRLRHLRIECHFRLLYDFSSIIQAAATTMDNGCFGTPEVLNIDYNHFAMSFKNGRHESSSSYAGLDLPIRSDARGAESDYAVIADVMACIANLNGGLFSPLVRLSINISIRLSRGQFAQLFGSLPRLKHIKVYNNLFTKLIETLSTDVDHPSNAPPTFPKLRSIMWIQSTMNSQSNFLDPVLFNDLHDCLIKRRDSNASIRTLDLVGCFLQEQIEQLEDVVAEVRVRSWQTYLGP
ncbi:hypothetical protein D9619_009995 [Psilocybe cf. subviscida]|uniref:F-box domain-containing protein n=1 Tax=Psilocybe cf. subviscida TaxID=2480587 RepID=A0A8H5F6G4_9AGAR|nr:hypothetical protein D9619_009995 [Psilocybe cf. subviscida]